jgi:orotate phosphoribosyltransferase
VKREEALQILRQTETLRQGHFQLTSGRHSGQFLLCSHLMQHPAEAEQFCRAMAEPFLNAGIETVVGPAMGGVILAYEVARQLALGGRSRPRAIFCEKADMSMALRRGWSVRQGERILVVEDAVTTGGSVYKVLDVLHQAAADVVAVSIIADRSGGTVDFGVPLHAVLSLEIESWLPQDCPLCKEGMPLVRPKS